MKWRPHDARSGASWDGPLRNKESNEGGLSFGGNGTLGRDMAHDRLCDIPLRHAKEEEEGGDDGNYNRGIVGPQVFEPRNGRRVQLGHEEGDNGALEEAGECRVKGVRTEVNAEHTGREQRGGSDAWREANDKHRLADVAVKEVAAGFNLVLMFLHPLEFGHVTHRKAHGEVHQQVADKDAPEGALEGGHPMQDGFGKERRNDGPADDVLKEEGGDCRKPPLEPREISRGSDRFNKRIQINACKGEVGRHRVFCSLGVLSAGMPR